MSVEASEAGGQLARAAHIPNLSSFVAAVCLSVALCCGLSCRVHSSLFITTAAVILHTTVTRPKVSRCDPKPTNSGYPSVQIQSSPSTPERGESAERIGWLTRGRKPDLRFCNAKRERKRERAGYRLWVPHLTNLCDGGPLGVEDGCG